MSEEISAAVPARPKQFVYSYPQASPCAALLIYCGGAGGFDLLTTTRAPHMGGGRCLSAGGFYEVKDMFNEAGKFREGHAELYREAFEELGEGFKEIIPYDNFCDRVEYLWDGMRRLGESYNVHNIIWKILSVTREELDAIMALPPTEEQVGKTIEHFRTNGDSHVPVSDQVVRARLADFHYDIEVEAAAMFFRKMEKINKSWDRDM